MAEGKQTAIFTAGCQELHLKGNNAFQKYKAFSNIICRARKKDQLCTGSYIV